MQFLSMTRTSPNPRHFARLGRGAVLALALMGTHSGVSADDFAFCTDGVCVGESLCNATQWEMEAPSPENENLRTCAALTLCEEGHAELVAPTATSDRTCGPAAAAAAADEAVDTAPAAEEPVAADRRPTLLRRSRHHRWPTSTYTVRGHTKSTHVCQLGRVARLGERPCTFALRKTSSPAVSSFACVCSCPPH